MKKHVTGAVVFLFFCAVFLLAAGSCFAADVVEEEGVSPRDIKPKPMLGGKFVEQGKIKSLLATGIGFDNNAYLDSRRHKDAFTQIFLKSTFTSPLQEGIQALLEYEVFNLLYADSSALNLFALTLRGGLDFKINDDAKLITDYSFGVTEYYSSGTDDFYDHRIGFTFKQKLPLRFSHAFDYHFSVKDYMERKTRDTATVYRDKGRLDLRNTVDYSVSKQFATDLVKVGFRYFFNDSNERYLDYYDYDSYQPYLSITHLFGPKLFGYASVARQYRYYTHRTAIGVAAKEKDYTYVLTQALYYSVNKKFTVGVSHNYRKNDSNEPSSRYSGSLFSLNGYYSF